MSKTHEIFELYYEGAAVEEGSIDVNDFAPGLIALGELFGEINKQVTAEEGVVNLRVKAGFKKGSFITGLEIVFNNFVSIFNSNEAQAISVFLGISGISGLGIFQLLKAAKGKKPKGVVEIEHTTKVRIQFEGEPPIEVEKAVFNIFKNIKARDAISRFTQPLSKGIRTIRFKYKGNDAVNIPQGEREYYKSPSEHENELVSESEQYFQLIAMSFKDGDKWRVSDGTHTYFVSILDPMFLKQIKTRSILFGDNDFIKVTLRTIQWTEGGILKTSHQIVKVLEHKPSPNQLDFGL